jgi:Mn-dependent DtxR family transcriptional regulator
MQNTKKPKYLKTTKMAEFLDVDPSFLRHNKEKLFFEGFHYYQPYGGKILRWDAEVMELWLHGKTKDYEEERLLQKLVG